MRYRAIAKVICHTCKNVWVIDSQGSESGFVEAKSEAEAAERFRMMHVLCPTCLKGGIAVAVEFSGPIRIHNLPALGTK